MQKVSVLSWFRQCLIYTPGYAYCFGGNLVHQQIERRGAGWTDISAVVASFEGQFAGLFLSMVIDYNYYANQNMNDWEYAARAAQILELYQVLADIENHI